MESFFSNILSFTGSPDIWVFLIFLAWCFISEVGFSIPYLLESFWLLVGFNVATGALAPGYIIALWLTAQAGRQAGSMALYRIACYGMPSLEKLFRKLHLDKLYDKIKKRSGNAGSVNLVTPFSVAFGRMFAMRVPMALACAAKRKRTTLILGVALSSLIWDALYISLGAVFGATVEISQGYMLLISLGAITAISILFWAAKKLVQRLRRPAAPKTSLVPAPVHAFPSMSGVSLLAHRFAWAFSMSAVLLLFPVAMLNRFSKKLR